MDLIFIVLLVVLVLAAVLYWWFFMKKKSADHKAQVDMPQESSDAGASADVDTVVSETLKPDMDESMESSTVDDSGMGGEDLLADNDEEVK